MNEEQLIKLCPSLKPIMSKFDLNTELHEINNKLFWLLKYPQEDSEWSISPKAVIERRTKLIQRKEEILKLLKTPKKD